MKWRGLWLAAVATLLPACGGHPEPVSAPDWSRCQDRSGDPGSLARVAELEGQFGLDLGAVSGPETGATTRGTLTLIAGDSAGAPLRGWTDAALAEVGAQEVGDPGSQDPEAPGVLVLSTPDPTRAGQIGSITLRLGSLANREGVLLFDGAWTALYVRWIDEGGFGGEWSSGVTGPEATGRFCAVRTGDR